MARMARGLDPRMKACEEWVKLNTGLGFAVGNFHANLKSGVALCMLAYKIDPKSINAKYAKPSTRKLMAFAEKEKITQFIGACRKMGVREADLFTTNDLHEASDLKKVVECLENLSSLCQKKFKHIKGGIGIKHAEKNERHFTDAQKRAAVNAIPFASKGAKQVKDHEHVDSFGIVMHSNVSKTVKK